MTCETIRYLMFLSSESQERRRNKESLKSVKRNNNLKLVTKKKMTQIWQNYKPIHKRSCAYFKHDKPKEIHAK
jgi:hypothetical protein